MRLSELLGEDNVISDLKARDKKAVLEELAQTIVDQEPGLDKSSLVKVLLDRERLGSTGIGDGVAIPHGKFNGLSQPMVSFGRSRKGLDFESMDGQPAFLFFLLFSENQQISITIFHCKLSCPIECSIKINHNFRICSCYFLINLVQVFNFNIEKH